MKIQSFIILTTISSGVLSSQGAVIIDYISSNAISISASTVNGAVTADSLVAGSGLTQGTGGTFNWSGWDTASTDHAAALAANDYFSWGFDVSATGSTVDLTTLDIRLDRSNTGPGEVRIQASVNGGSAVTLTTIMGLSSSGSNFTGIDLSGIGSLTTGDSVVFTLTAHGSTSSGGTFDVENLASGEGIIVNGNVTVPEPSTALLGGLALLGLLRRRR